MAKNFQELTNELFVLSVWKSIGSNDLDLPLTNETISRCGQREETAERTVDRVNLDDRSK